MLQELGYPDEEHEAKLKELTEVQNERDAGRRILPQCLPHCSCENYEDDGLVIYIESQGGKRIALVIEDGETIDGVKQKVRKNAYLLRHFYARNDLFTKTGSGQA
jgi:hypothetical protein